MANHAKSCTVVGSGMSGLVAARMLKDAGLEVKVIDKGKGPGGRIATRRVANDKYGQGVFDYGAQYFKARDDRFRIFVKDWIRDGIAKEWSSGFYLENGNFKGDGEFRYIGVDGMRGIAKHLARELEIYQSIRVSKFEFSRGLWSVIAEPNAVFESSILVLTPPIPQTLELVDSSGIILPDDSRHSLESIIYDPCIALLAFCDRETIIPEPGGIWGSGSPIRWISDNYRKGVSREARAVTIHASADFSKTFWDEAESVIFNELFLASRHLIGAEIPDYQIHKWLYSEPINTYPSTFLYLDNPGPLYFGGDAFASPSIEGAFISGYEMAMHIISEL